MKNSLLAFALTAAVALAGCDSMTVPEAAVSASQAADAASDASKLCSVPSDIYVATESGLGLRVYYTNRQGHGPALIQRSLNSGTWTTITDDAPGAYGPQSYVDAIGYKVDSGGSRSVQYRVTENCTQALYFTSNYSPITPVVRTPIFAVE